MLSRRVPATQFNEKHEYVCASPISAQHFFPKNQTYTADTKMLNFLVFCDVSSRC